MWKALWRTWTIDKPAALGDWLWDVFVVQLAAFLNRLTIREVVAFIPVVILVFAYYHKIPIPPELMLVGDLLAYIDLFSVLFLLSVLARVETVLLVARQVTARVFNLLNSLVEGLQRRDFRHRRQGAARKQKRLTDRAKTDDDDFVTHGAAWA